ncbi:transcriptional regulator [Streptomyces sp. AcH 505]|jgi:two-component system, OmpR family, response regulator QseB|uniref:response regulator n=1 Tax=Streptomyces sp. AcH 505 TaxID=352211 RepID=UPI0005924288|nr:transcriptional regulator [Streptomyces sp. AcH 505]
MRILVVEDDPLILNGLAMGLSLHSMVVDGVNNCEDAHAALATTQFNAVVLDWMLPDGSGIDVLRDMRSRKDTTPVLLLTARDAVEDRIRGLDEGADDYLGKPFDLDEVAARLRALDRRAAGRSIPNLVWQDLTLNPATMEVSLESKPLILSRREFAVLSALMERPGIIVSRSQLEGRLYGWQEDVGSNAVEVHVHNLRTKIGRQRIQTLRGIGYRLRSENI